jgi:hypothetical protein
VNYAPDEVGRTASGALDGTIPGRFDTRERTSVILTP